MPWRQGGKGHAKPPKWVGCASHMCSAVLDLAPSKRLTYTGEWRSKPERAIYLLDQAMARAGVQYFATLAPSQHAPCFAVHVRSADVERARVVIQQTEPKRA